MLGLQTYVTVPLINADGGLEGTLCGASRNRVTLGPETLRVMERFAALIWQANGQKRPLRQTTPEFRRGDYLDESRAGQRPRS